MLVRLNSKFDVRRLCQVTGATVLPTLSIPSVEELGYIERARTDEIADTSVVIFEQGKFSLLYLVNSKNALLSTVSSAHFQLQARSLWLLWLFVEVPTPLWMILNELLMMV